MGNLQETRRRAKRDVDQIVALHRELNPHPGQPLLVALDTATGQLFFCSATGSCTARDAMAARRDPDRLYELERDST